MERLSGQITHAGPLLSEDQSFGLSATWFGLQLSIGDALSWTAVCNGSNDEDEIAVDNFKVLLSAVGDLFGLVLTV